jgi:competence protein ComEA
MNILKTLVAVTFSLLSALAVAATDVNKASQAELESIKGIGPSMSARILDARKTGAFKDWTDLQSRVKGVRSGNAAKFSADGLTVNGAAFSAVAMAATNASAKPAKAPKAERNANTSATANSK